MKHFELLFKFIRIKINKFFNFIVLKCIYALDIITYIKYYILYNIYLH
jgi:hypothetical protein